MLLPWLSARLLAPPPMVAHDGFDASSVPRPVAFDGAVLKGKIVEITVPARSVVVLTFQ